MMQSLHGFKTFILCALALVGFFVVSLIMGHEIDGAELAIVIGAIAGLYGINDLAGAARDKARKPSVPDNVADVEAQNVTVQT